MNNYMSMKLQQVLPVLSKAEKNAYLQDYLKYYASVHPDHPNAFGQIHFGNRRDLIDRFLKDTEVAVYPNRTIRNKISRGRNLAHAAGYAVRKKSNKNTNDAKNAEVRRLLQLKNENAPVRRGTGFQNAAGKKYIRDSLARIISKEENPRKKPDSVRALARIADRVTNRHSIGDAQRIEHFTKRRAFGGKTKNTDKLNKVAKRLNYFRSAVADNAARAAIRKKLKQQNVQRQLAADFLAPNRQKAATKIQHYYKTHRETSALDNTNLGGKIKNQIPVIKALLSKIRRNQRKTHV